MFGLSVHKACPGAEGRKVICTEWFVSSTTANLLYIYICIIKNTVLDASTTLAATVYWLIAKLRLGG